MKSRSKRRDKNHRSIVEAFERCFVSVLDISQVGGGCPDLLIGCLGQNILIEIKSVDGDLLPSQRLFAETWRGRAPVVVRTPAEAHAVATALRLSASLGAGLTPPEH